MMVSFFSPSPPPVDNVTMCPDGAMHRIHNKKPDHRVSCAAHSRAAASRIRTLARRSASRVAAGGPEAVCSVAAFLSSSADSCSASTLLLASAAARLAAKTLSCCSCRSGGQGNDDSSFTRQLATDSASCRIVLVVAGAVSLAGTLRGPRALAARDARGITKRLLHYLASGRSMIHYMVIGSICDGT